MVSVSQRLPRIRMHCCPVPHDDPQVAVVMEDDGGDRVGLVTDLGRVPRSLERHLEGCRTLLLESNHEPELLATADYPHFLRDRIASPHGHLSNVDAARLLKRLARQRLERVTLMHLSQKANSPRRALARALAAVDGHGVEVRVAHQDNVATYDKAPRRPARPLALRATPNGRQLIRCSGATDCRYRASPTPRQASNHSRWRRRTASGAGRHTRRAQPWGRRTGNGSTGRFAAHLPAT